MVEARASSQRREIMRGHPLTAAVKEAGMGKPSRTRLRTGSTVPPGCTGDHCDAALP